MRIHDIKKITGNKGKSKRVGRGVGSGKGAHTVGKGMKGQKSRSGNSIPRGFEGGQVPLFKKLPQIGGFRNPASKKIVGVSLSKFNLFKEGSEVTPENLLEKNVLKKLPKHGVKILGNGDLVKKLKFKNFHFSKTAKEKIEKAGGTIL